MNSRERGVAAVEIDGRHQRLEHVGQQRRRHAGMRGHALAQDQELLQAQRLADLGAGLPADDDRLDLRQIAFEILGILVEQQLADDGAQNGVAEKFQPLVRGQPVLAPGGVRQGGRATGICPETCIRSAARSVSNCRDCIRRLRPGVRSHATSLPNGQDRMTGHSINPNRAASYFQPEQPNRPRRRPAASGII